MFFVAVDNGDVTRRVDALFDMPRARIISMMTPDADALSPHAAQNTTMHVADIRYDVYVVEMLMMVFRDCRKNI